MQTELSDTYAEEEMMPPNQGIFNSNLPPSLSESSLESSSESNSESSSESPSDSSSSSDVREIRVALEIGHSEKDPGAVFEPPFDKEYKGEYDYWLQNAQAVADQIRSEFESNKDKLPTPTELSVRIFNRGDYSSSLGQMIVAVKNWKPDVAVGLHLNASSNKYAIGHLCVKKPAPGKNPTPEQVQVAAKAAELASCINERLTKIPHTRREDTDGSEIAWCRDIEGAVVVEPGFVSTPSDASFLCRMEKEIAGSIASGIYDYMVDKGYAVRARA